MVVFPFAFHIAVQQPFKPLWSRLLLYELNPSRASFALCFKSLLMTLLPASVLVSLFVLLLPFDLSSKGGPSSSYATAGIAIRVTDVLKPPHHDKVETPTRRMVDISSLNIINFCTDNVFLFVQTKCNFHMIFISNIPQEYLCMSSGREV